MSGEPMVAGRDPMFSETLRSFAAFMRTGFDEADREMVAAKFMAAAAEVERLTAAADAEMERVKACEHIAEGDEGWETLRDLCPSTAAVARLRDDYRRIVLEEMP